MAAARMFLPPKYVGYIADVGRDFPPEFRAALENLGEMVWFRERKGNTTRALNQYSGARIGYVPLAAVTSSVLSTVKLSHGARPSPQSPPPAY
jgi:hypothetical protein